MCKIRSMPDVLMNEIETCEISQRELFLESS